jgi:hypothetical protein
MVRWAIVVTLLAGALTSAGAAPAAAEDAVPALVPMVEPAISSFASDAAALPDDLIEALEEGPGLTGSEYLAQADAAVNATATIASLSSAGVTLRGTRLDGTSLTVFVANESQAALVERAGATAIVGKPVVQPANSSGARLTRAIEGGDPLLWDAAEGRYRCTVGFTGHSITTGADLLLTAGHCTSKKKYNGGYYLTGEQDEPISKGGSIFSIARVAKSVSGAAKLGNGYDAGVLAVTSTSSWEPTPTILAGGANGTMGTSLAITDVIPAIVGMPVCKSGGTTGWTCGTVLRVNDPVAVIGATGTISSITTDVCMLPGDSGGPAVSGSVAIGINSWSSFSSCSSTNRTSGFFPLVSNVSSKPSVAKLVGKKWELAVEVAEPQVIVPEAGLVYESALTGTLENGNVRHTVEVRIDGASKPLVGRVASDGTWSVDFDDVLPGAHTAVVRASWGARSDSTDSDPVPFTVIEPTLAAMARSATAPEDSVARSKSTRATSAPVVYLSTAAVEVDTLDAISAAVRSRSTILFIDSDALPGVVEGELRRLRPSKIIIVGPKGVVSSSVVTKLRTIAPSVTRVSLRG